ncbi:sensor histidine kinase [Clostridium perfringens]|nr:sensor histidine kinase [Clostridium perfringens]
MSLNKIFISTLKKEKVAILLYVINTATIMLYYYFIYDKERIYYPIILTTTFLVIYFIYKFFVYKELANRLAEGIDSPKYKLAEGYAYEDIIDGMKELHNKYLKEIHALEDRSEAKDKLMAEWIHNMKTSVAIIKLATEQGKEDFSLEVIKDIEEENNNLQENLEGALNVFRLDQFYKDYVPEKINLKNLVNKAINAQKRNFIYSKVEAKLELHRELFVYTDKKWSKYLLEQIISNAIKYSYEGCVVNFYAKEEEEKVILCIEDRGRGIKKEEIERVFEAFFTGTNGRKTDKATGIGLYICKLICDMLKHEINIISEEGFGTTVEISFQKVTDIF